MTGLGIERENNFYKPKIGAALNAGSQDFNFGLQPYALLALNFEMNLYDHKRHSYRKDQAKAAATSQGWLQEQVKRQIDLQSAIAEQNLTSAIAQAKTFMPRISAAERNYKDVFTRYKVGSANYLELLDAQGLLTQTQLQYQVAKSNAWIKWAELIYSKAILSIE
ncbi:MAG: TolC family protein [Saprospiraceae bacterium]|nr:TolC family protein [Saprospiraceae bacterium]